MLTNNNHRSFKQHSPLLSQINKHCFSCRHTRIDHWSHDALFHMHQINKYSIKPPSLTLMHPLCQPTLPGLYYHQPISSALLDDCQTYPGPSIFFWLLGSRQAWYVDHSVWIWIYTLGMLIIQTVEIILILVTYAYMWVVCKIYSDFLFSMCWLQTTSFPLHFADVILIFF